MPVGVATHPESATAARTAVAEAITMRSTASRAPAERTTARTYAPRARESIPPTDGRRCGAGRHHRMRHPRSSASLADEWCDAGSDQEVRGRPGHDAVDRERQE